MVMDYKKDSHTFGGILGLVLPILAFFLLYAIAWIVNAFVDFDMQTIWPVLRLPAIVINLFAIRYYFVNLKYELTGRGLLLVTFIYIIVYFSLFN